MADFSDFLLEWYHKNKRDLPWRATQNPYKIWLSEIILQQTRVEQGMSYYQAFVEKYPTVKHLAAASEQEVLRLWQGLGYYSRARNLHAAAKYIVSELGGRFPDNYNDLLQLKGVGKYTAAAIASFAYEEAVPAIDGNVYRVLSRIFSIATPIHTGKAEKEFREAAQELMPANAAGDFNQAMMELGATVCKPSNPQCETCPVVFACSAFEQKKQLSFPVKKTIQKIKHRYFHYLIIKYQNTTVIRKRTEKDIWQHLYEFPLIEKEKPTLADFVKFLETIFEVKSPVLTRLDGREKVHKLSHQHIHLSFWEVCVDGLSVTNDYEQVVQAALEKYPMPAALNSWQTEIFDVE